jgi:hypothetical protein
MESGIDKSQEIKKKHNFDKFNKKKCEHNKRESRCVECGGVEVCEHKRLKYNCKDCKGNGICEHGKYKTRCKLCEGGSYCEHKRIRICCKLCGGSQICEHNKLKLTCKECEGTLICEHKKLRGRCVDCNGSQICEHKKVRQQCIECKGSGICEHNKRRAVCIECGGSEICGHKKLRGRCKSCKGSQICKHNKFKNICKDCDGSRLCQHKIQKRRCKTCKGVDICIHDKYKGYCKICCPDSKYFCKSCRLFFVMKKTNYLCSYCNPDKVIQQKTKEIALKKFLDENYQDIIYNKKVNMNNTCQTYFPDFLKDRGTFFLIIECDEKAHDSYPVECEKIRENNIAFSLGLPCVFIRYNPDKKKIPINVKQIVLKSYIDYYLSKEYCDNEVVYLFY